MNRIVREAESWMGTPYRWNCKVKGIKGGVSCGDLIEQVYKKTGCLSRAYQLPTVYRDWHIQPEKLKDKGLFKREVMKFSTPLEDWEQRRPTDVAMFQWGGVDSHIAIIVGDDCIIHAITDRKVMKHRFRSFRSHLTGVYRPFDEILLGASEMLCEEV